MPKVDAKRAPMLYKGAGPGTHWHSTDARLSGFSSPRQVVGSINYALSPITAHIKT